MTRPQAHRGFRLDFSGIGVAKAGTTWIARCLAEHPAVCMAASKETNFFLRSHIAAGLPRPFYYSTAHYDEGLSWYERQFSHHVAGQLRGEFSNAYLADAGSAALLHAHNPSLKLLCSFRDPVEVAYAGYYQLSRVQPLPDSFEQTLERYPQLLDYGLYHRHLQPFLKLFPRERIHLVVYDDIKADPPGFYRRICEFLEIDAGFVPNAVGQRVNPRTVLRSRRLRDLRCAISVALSRTAATRRLRTAMVRLGARRLLRPLFLLNEKPGTVPPIAPATRCRLAEFYRSDVAALGDLLHRDLSRWTACP